MFLTVLLGLQATSTFSLGIEDQEKTSTDVYQAFDSKMARPEQHKDTALSPMMTITSLFMTGIILNVCMSLV